MFGKALIAHWQHNLVSETHLFVPRSFSPLEHLFPADRTDLLLAHETQALTHHAAPGGQAGSIIVALSAAACFDDLIDVACTVAHAHHTHLIHAIYGIEVPRSRVVDDDLPAEQHAAAAVLAHAQDIAHLHHIHIEGEWVQTREWGAALVQIADHLGGPLLVIGAPALTDASALRSGEDDIAQARALEAADYVLRHAPCEVWVERSPMPADLAMTA